MPVPRTKTGSFSISPPKNEQTNGVSPQTPIPPTIRTQDVTPNVVVAKNRSGFADTARAIFADFLPFASNSSRRERGIFRKARSAATKKAARKTKNAIVRKQIVLLMKIL